MAAFLIFSGDRMVKVTFSGPPQGRFREFEQFCRRKLERVALEAAHDGGRMALSTIRQRMAGANLGRLGNALGSNSDLSQGGGVHARSNGFSASANVHIRSGSERARGALIAYTEGASIRGVKSPWLWIPATEMQRRVKGGWRLTPGRWQSSGLEARFGPLFMIPGRHAGEQLLVFKDVTARIYGKPAFRKIPKSGRIRAGREVRDTVVAFVGIRQTSRQARVDVPAVMAEVQNALPTLIMAAFRKV